MKSIWNSNIHYRRTRFIQTPIYDGNLVYSTDSFLRPWRIKAHTFSRSPLCEKRLRSAWGGGSFASIATESEKRRLYSQATIVLEPQPFQDVVSKCVQGDEMIIWKKIWRATGVSTPDESDWKNLGLLPYSVVSSSIRVYIFSGHLQLRFEIKSIRANPLL